MRMNFMMKMWVYYCCRGLFYLLVFVKLRKILGKKSKKLLIFWGICGGWKFYFGKLLIGKIFNMFKFKLDKLFVKDLVNEIKIWV